MDRLVFQSQVLSACTTLASPGTPDHHALKAKLGIGLPDFAGLLPVVEQVAPAIIEGIIPFIPTTSTPGAIAVQVLTFLDGLVKSGQLVAPTSPTAGS